MQPTQRIGAAIALKKNTATAAEAAEAIGEGLQAFCIPGSVAEDRKVGLGHGNLGAMLLRDETKCFAFLAGHESFAAAEGAIGIVRNANKARKEPLRVILNGLGKDAALCWHPDDSTGPKFQTSLANCEVLYKFDGVASHAGTAPHLGRSALDAVELMDSGANYMREHMIDEARVHYAIVDTGGFSPNVVQSHAEVLYLIRAPHNDQVKELYERV